ncbi:MAG: hypothetical protein AB1505_11075 [Candidatus Latescibacterota bacterium]
MLRVMCILAALGVVLAPVAVLTGASLATGLGYTVAVEAVLAGLLIVFTDELGPAPARRSRLTRFERRYL